jgi:hypothetical protein
MVVAVLCMWLPYVYCHLICIVLFSCLCAVLNVLMFAQLPAAG